MLQLAKLRVLFVPASIVLFLLFAAGWYNLFWLPSESRYLDDRNFRVLHTLGDQIRFTIDNFDKIMDNADASGISKDDLNEYLHNVAPQLEVPEKGESDPVIGKDFSDPPKIAVTADEGTHYLYLAFKGKSSEYAIRTDLDKLINRLSPPANRNPFDVLLVAKSDGAIIFQKPLSGLDVARIDNLEKASTDAKKTPQDTQLTVKSLSGASNLEEVMLEGARYRLYAQPLTIPFALAEPGKKKGKGAGIAAVPDPWILCALVRADHFRSESQSISYKYLLWLSAGILMVIAVYPFLRIHVSSCEERLRASQVSIAAVVACVLAATVTFALLDVYYWSHEFDVAAEEQMNKLADAIDKNFTNEQQKAFDQLSEFYREDSPNKNVLRIALRNAQSQFDKHPKLKNDGAGCDPSWSCRAKILSDRIVADLLKSYPYLEYVGWTDFRGDQRVKWTTRKSVTPFYNLDSPSIPYYPDVKSALQSPGGSNPIPTEGVGANFSPNTGRMVTVFWKIMDTEGNPVTIPIPHDDQKKVFCASLVTNPLSVVGPILPEGFQFAVIKPDGSVVFHSDTTLNLREDFFVETDHDQGLRARISMRLEGSLIANYMGQPHRLYLQPMASSPSGSWTIVIFRTLRDEGTMNLEMLSLSSMLFLLYAGILALVLLLMGWIRGNRAIGVWLWPDSRKIHIYRRLFVANGLAALLLFTLSQMSSLAALIVYGIVIPLGTAILNFLFLRRQDDRSSENGNKKSPAGHWQRAYIAASVTLLVVVAVLPCLFFFKVACDFEQKLAMKRMQLNLVGNIDKRAERVRSRYQGLELKEFASDLLAGPKDGPDEKGTPFFSYHKTLGTTIEPSPEKPPQSDDCGLGSSSGRQRCAELFLSLSSPLYNELAARTRYLGEAGSSATRFWSSDSSGAKETLTLITSGRITSGRRIASPWTPFRAQLGEWQWWLGPAVFISLVTLMVRFTLYRLFLLDPLRPIQETSSTAVLDPADLIVTLPKNLLVIGPESCRTIRDLIEREDVQVWDTRKKSAWGIANVPFAEAVDCIVQEGRPLVLRIVDSALEDLDSSRKIRLALEKIISKLGKSVVIISQVDPGAGAVAAERERWQTLLSAFVRLDLHSSPAWRAGEADDQFDRRTIADAYYRWRFFGLPESQQLVLVHLAQDGLINPNSRSVAWELLENGLIGRPWGTLAINDPGFADYLKSAVPPNTVKDLEKQAGSGHSASLQVSLSVAVIGVVGFLIYTQGEVFNTWVTYATGFAAGVPAFMKAFSMLRGKGGANA